MDSFGDFDAQLQAEDFYLQEQELADENEDEVTDEEESDPLPSSWRSVLDQIFAPDPEEDLLQREILDIVEESERKRGVN
jgi:hypothetical protein